MSTIEIIVDSTEVVEVIEAGPAGVSGGIGEAPSDGAQYVRKNTDWAVLEEQIIDITNIGIEEAPIDGEQYARIDGVWKIADHTIRMDFRASYLANTSNSPLMQLCAASDTPQPITYNNTILEHPPSKMSLDNVTGEFTFLVDLHSVSIDIDAQIIRTVGGNGKETWGIFFEYFDGTDWLAVDDTTRHITMDKESDDEIQHYSYSALAGDIAEGTKLRIMQVCSNANKNMGIVSARPFSVTPISAGVIISISGSMAHEVH